MNVAYKATTLYLFQYCRPIKTNTKWAIHSNLDGYTC